MKRRENHSCSISTFAGRVNFWLLVLQSLPRSRVRFLHCLFYCRFGSSRKGKDLERSQKRCCIDSHLFSSYLSSHATYAFRLNKDIFSFLHICNKNLFHTPFSQIPCCWGKKAIKNIIRHSERFSTCRSE